MLSADLRRVVSNAGPRVARVRRVAVREEREEEGARRAEQRAVEGQPPPLGNGAINSVLRAALTVEAAQRRAHPRRREGARGAGNAREVAPPPRGAAGTAAVGVVEPRRGLRVKVQLERLAARLDDVEAGRYVRSQCRDCTATIPLTIPFTMPLTMPLTMPSHMPSHTVTMPLQHRCRCTLMMWKKRMVPEPSSIFESGSAAGRPEGGAGWVSCGMRRRSML